MIVWLASYPRSGNTFLRILLSEFFGLNTYSVYNDKLDIGSSEHFSKLVGHKHYSGDWDDFYSEASSAHEFTAVKTHDGPVDDSKAIYVVRDPRAVAVSLYHYLRNYGRYDFTMEDVVLGATTFGSWRKHLELWEPKNRPNTLFLHFEKIIKDPHFAVEAIGDFLEIEKKDAELTTFQNLQREYPNFFRSGSNEKNISQLSDAQLSLISLMNAEIMANYGYEDGGAIDYPLARALLETQAEKTFKVKQDLVQKNARSEAEFEQIKKILWRIENVQKQEVEHASKIAKRADARLGDLNQRLADTTAMLAKKDDQIAKEKASNATLRDSLAGEKDLSKSLTATASALEKRLGDLEFVLEPRLKSILSLRPLRFALKERNLIKAGKIPAKTKWASPASETAKSARSKTPNDLIKDVREQVSRRSIKAKESATKDLSIALFAHDRVECVVNVLEALALQNALENTYVWIDGDQGNPQKRIQVDLVHECVAQYPVKAVYKNRGNFGFRKMMLLSMKTMMSQSENILFLEDDCFPTQDAVGEFSRALDRIKDDDSIFSVYGHPFMIDNEQDGIFRFQGWGWATTARKLEPIWRQLMDCYLMTEDEYLTFVDENLTPELEAALDVTPPRQPTNTLRKFFAWDETLGLLAAMSGMRHLRTPERLIYNFGAGPRSSHFSRVEHFRKPPFNMISVDEVWDCY